MKKTLIAAALFAGFAGAAQAETSVTLYGVIDTGLGYNKISGAADGYNGSRVGMINGMQNGSRWGLRGSEDLGDGLRAVFQLESAFNSGNGKQGAGVAGQGSRLFDRQSTIGLASDSWGRLDFGRQTNIASKYFESIDPFGTNYGMASMGVGMSAANMQRYDNMVMYQTPSFSGLQFGVGYSFSANDESLARGRVNFRTADNLRALTTGVRYVNGPLNVALTYDQLNPSNAEAKNAGQVTPRSFMIGGSYDFEVVKLALAYARTTNGWFAISNPTGASGEMVRDRKVTDLGFGSNAATKDFKANSYMVGLSAPIGGASSVFTSWQHVSANDKLTEDDATMNIFSLGYTYDLSKRTNLYAYGSYGKNYAFNDGVKATAIGVGLRHRF
ncbi:porin [Achromobacter sp. Marseille-Q0513]|uniref:porin n=1 Tax=Achromobacter sp. Marseille-Q0513 TaxID=2829161 RepID=UPI001B9BAF50|nr:porin [Achromobacter sp. Marseille-Q0513]MBR8655306.1 porin [Achromobacter sp. Marseille-Q0513]